MLYTIQDLADGKVAVEFIKGNSLTDLNALLKKAFPNDTTESSGDYQFYLKDNIFSELWAPHVKGDLPTPSQPLSLFLKSPENTEPQFTVDSLAAGKVALYFDKEEHKVQDLQSILSEAFPDDVDKATGEDNYYFAYDTHGIEWQSHHNKPSSLPTAPITAFLDNKEIKPPRKRRTQQEILDEQMASALEADQEKLDNLQSSDPVNHPSHYTSGKIEVIDFIEDQKLGMHLGNAVKYIARAGKKDPAKTIQDLEKAIWYLKRFIDREKDNQI